MNIDIQSLFRDILETPEQRQQRELAETTLRSREMTRNITSRYAAPFAGMVPGFLSNVNRATTGLGSALGLDMRSTSEKAQEALSGLDLTNPQSVQNTVQMLRGAGLGAQAAQILGMSAEAIQKQEKETTLFDQQVEINKLRAIELEQLIERNAREAAQETIDYTNAQNIFQASKDILQRVSPYLAGQIESLFPPTIEGAEQARKFALELARSPEEKERQFREVTIINEQTGMPEIVLFDDNDETYRRVLGVDDAALEANGGNKFSNVSVPPGQALSSEAFSAESHAKKLLSIAFNPNLEQVVGPAEARRMAPTFMLTPDAAALRKEIDRSITAGTLPIIRAFAPVTETDVALLQDIQLGFGDSQEVWIQKTIEENVPQSLNVLERSLIEDGQGLSAAHQMRLATSEEILSNVVNNPSVFGDYSLEDAVGQAISLLPNANNIDVKEIPKDITIFKSPSGTIFSAEIIELIRQRQQLSQEEIIDGFDLTLIEK